MERRDLPFLRTLYTGFWTEQVSITTLEQPNIISDTPAAGNVFLVESNVDIITRQYTSNHNRF